MHKRTSSELRERLTRFVVQTDESLSHLLFYDRFATSNPSFNILLQVFKESGVVFLQKGVG